MDWSDKRPINELRFGVEWKPTLGELQTKQPGYGAVDAPFGLREGDPPGAEVLITWNETHKEKLASVKAILTACGCATADDIVALGCTGVAHKLPGEVATALAQQLGFSLFGTSTGAEDEMPVSVERAAPRVFRLDAADRRHPSIEIIRFLRMGLGGSGVGLPCYVPPNRYCCAHQVTGGLQDGQEQRYPEEVNVVSRELLPEERAQAELLDHARTAEGADREAATADMLAGRKLPPGWVRGEGLLGQPEAVPESALLDAGLADAKAGRVAPIPLSVLAESVWKCPEHTETVWACRYCVAQAIVEGDLLPEYLVGTESLDGPSQAGSVDAHDLGAFIEKKSVEGWCAQLDVHVLVARYTRKLSR